MSYAPLALRDCTDGAKRKRRAAALASYQTLSLAQFRPHDGRFKDEVPVDQPLNAATDPVVPFPVLAADDVEAAARGNRLAEADVRAVLVAAIELGVNDHEIGKIVDFGLRHPAIFGVNFQPAFRAQRHLAMDPMNRMTIPDVLKALELQTAGRFRMDDFVPVPCCMPTCNFVTYALLSGDEVTPITRLVDVEGHLDYLKNRTLATFDQEILATLERLWSSSVAVGSDIAAGDVHRAVNGSASRCPACHVGLPLSSHGSSDLARHVFMVNTRDFMDPWTFNVKNVMKCCVEFVIPDGRLIPFCAYNSVGYRERVTADLHAAVRSTRQAHTRGT